MTSEASTRKVSVIDKSPWVFAVALVVFLVSLWHAPVSVGYLLVAAAAGLLFGCALALAYATRYRDFILAVWPMILIVAQIVSRYVFFSSSEREADRWSIAFQFFGLAYVLTFGLAWVCRNRINS
jgi:hypothetical protein